MRFLETSPRAIAAKTRNKAELLVEPDTAEHPLDASGAGTAAVSMFLRLVAKLVVTTSAAPVPVVGSQPTTRAAVPVLPVTAPVRSNPPKRGAVTVITGAVELVLMVATGAEPEAATLLTVTCSPMAQVRFLKHVSAVQVTFASFAVPLKIVKLLAVSGKVAKSVTAALVGVTGRVANSGVIIRAFEVFPSTVTLPEAVFIAAVADVTVTTAVVGSRVIAGSWVIVALISVGVTMSSVSALMFAGMVAATPSATNCS